MTAAMRRNGTEAPPMRSQLRRQVPPADFRMATGGRNRRFLCGCGVNVIPDDDAWLCFLDKELEIGGL
jgi:hypothetical protein